MEHPGKILVIDGDRRVARVVGRSLDGTGFDVVHSRTGNDGLRAMRERLYDLVVMELILPGLDGITLIRQALDAMPEQRIVVLSTVQETAAKVMCLDLGAVDYVTKPFATAELVARVQAHTRSRVRRGANVMTFGPLRLNVAERTTDVGDGPVKLSEREFHLLNLLVERRGQVCTRQELLAEVWGLTRDPGTRVLDVCVKRLRAKVGQGRIQTVRSAGYRLALAA